MKVQLLKYWETIQASYWFIPTLMALGAVALSIVTTTIDADIGSDWMEHVDWLHANRPEGARALLSTIAGSMITVAGVTFSITIVAVSHATSQFGPRLLTNFMRDRGNQVTLGTFIATFLYCLLVLRTIRSPEEAPLGPDLGITTISGAFVPHLSLLCGVILAMASIGVLIYFIHHVPESIHASNVTAGIGRELNEQINSLFPETVGYGAPEDDYDPRSDIPENFIEKAVPIFANGSGYVQHIDEARLLRTAVASDLLLRLEYRPGDFVVAGRPLVLACPNERVNESAVKDIRGAFVWGRQRSQRQDIRFLADELVEISARALSPSTNDPFTAITCMNWLGSALSNLTRRKLPSAYRYDDQQALRIIARPVRFEVFTQEVFESLRPYVETDRNAALHLMKILAEVGCDTENAAHREVLLHCAQSLKRGCDETLPHENDRKELEKRFRVTTQVLHGHTDRRALADEHPWISGSG